MTARIRSVEAYPLSARMPRPWVPSAPHLHIVVVTVTDENGDTGTGFSWTPTIGAASVLAMIQNDIAVFAVGRSSDPTELWDAAWTHLHEAGGGGVTTIALAGLDLALWDLAGHREARSLASLLGATRDRLPVYGSGVNLHYSLDELLAQVQRWIDRGISSVKIKVGKPDLAEDVDRVAAVRELLGPDRALMIDANQRWDIPQARAAAEALARFDLAWLEEPLRSDDTAGYRALRRDIDVPIAMGENVHTAYRFRDLIDAEAADIYQPNIVRVGGITPALRIADLVLERGARLAPHLLPDLSAQFAVALPGEVEVEDVEEAGFEELGLLAAPSPVKIDRAVAVVHERPGLGLEFVRS